MDKMPCDWEIDLNAAFVEPTLVRSAWPFTQDQEPILHKPFLQFLLGNGLTDIVNLDDYAHLPQSKRYQQEQEWAKQNKVEYRKAGIRVFSVNLQEEWLRIIDYARQAKGMCLIHCYAGKDRTGAGVTIALHERHNVPFPEAMKRGLTPEFGHYHFLKMDYPLYHFATRIKGKTFKDWMEKEYNAAEMVREYGGFFRNGVNSMDQAKVFYSLAQAGHFFVPKEKHFIGSLNF